MRRFWMLFVGCMLTATFVAAVTTLASAQSAAPPSGSHRTTSPKRSHRGHSRKRHAHKRPSVTSKRLSARFATAGGSDPFLFGDQGVEPTLDFNQAGSAEAFPFTNQTTGTAMSVVVYVDSSNRAATLVAAVYSNKSGHPGSRLASGSLSSPKTGAWNTVALGSAAVNLGSTYWVAVLGEGGALFFRDRLGGPCNSENSSQSNLSRLPSSWTSGPRWNTCPISAYVMGTVPTTTPPPAPSNSALPQVSGTTMGGHVLSTSNGSWTNSPSSFGYQWQDCDSSGANCANLSGATSSGYMLTSGDVGHAVRVVVTASNAGGSGSASSAQTAVVAATPPSAPSNTALPAISGAAQQGQTLSASNGSWSGSPSSFGYQWQDCDSSGANCANISGASSSSYTLASGDVGGTLRVVVTASNAGGSASATSAPTAVVSPPSAPVNAVPPVISGSAVQGQMLSTSNGSWSNGPTSYSYQWQDCDSSGASCANIAGATSSTYSLTAGDAGHEVVVVVTASNVGGSASKASLPTGVVSAQSTCTTTLSPGANLATAIAAAANGATICLEGGSYPYEQVTAAHTAFVTVEPVAGQTATVAGIQTKGVSFLRLQGLTFTSGVDMRSHNDHDIQVVDNNIGNACFGVAISGDTSAVTNVLVEGNTIHNLSTSHCNGSGYAAGQGVTINWGTNVTISYNTFSAIGEHYIQGCGSPTSVDHNTFEGPGTPDSGAHLNIWQIWSGGSNCSFTNNVIQPGAADPISLIFENGPGGNGSATMSNITVSGNLFDHDATQEPWQIGAINGLTLTNNTVVGSHYGSVIESEGGLSGSNYTIEHNIVVGTTNGSDISYGGCSSNCTFDYNVTDDGSAAQAGSTHNVAHWSPNWTDTTWYQPVGLPFPAGFTH